MSPLTRSSVLLAGPMLVAAVAVADFLTGYEVRLAILYLVPIAWMTWARGASWGFALSGTATATWMVSFQSMHLYGRLFYYYWEAAVIVTTFVVFVVLIARLRAAVERSAQIVALGRGVARAASEVEQSVAALSAGLERATRLVNAQAPAYEVLGALGDSRAEIARVRQLAGRLRDVVEAPAAPEGYGETSSVAGR